MRLATPRTLIRPLRVDDLDDFAALTGDPESMRFMGDGNPLTREQTLAWIPITHVNDAKDGWTTWAVAEPQTDAFLGFAGLPHGDDEGTIEITYALAPSARGQGLASEIVIALTAYAFQERGLTELFATIDPRNAGSQRVVEKAGFVEAARRIDSYGQDEILYRAERVTEEWRRCREDRHPGRTDVTGHQPGRSHGQLPLYRRETPADDGFACRVDPLRG